MSSSKTYLIAGATSGIGAAIKSKFIAAGHSIVSIGRNEESADLSRGITFVKHDFLNDEPLPDLHQKIDGLIYCPGTINLKPFSSLKEKDILDDFKVNVLGAFRFVHKYQSNLRESTAPSILLFSSVAAQVGMPFHTSVSISKAGVEGLTRSLAAEFAPKIRVNCIAPSLTDTPLATMLLNSETKRMANAERHPLKRIGTAEDIASLASFLVTEATWMTGQIIGINGGLGTLLK